MGNNIIKDLVGEVAEELSEITQKHKDFFLNQIEKDIKSIKGQIEYVKTALKQKDIENWEKREFTEVWKDNVKELKNMIERQKKVKSWPISEGKLLEGVFGKFDMGAGAKGNGITIWDRNQKQGGDYKTIAHISDDGKLKIYDNDVKKEKELMKRLSIMVMAQKDYWKSVGKQLEGQIKEAKKYKPNQKISKQEWSKIKKFNKHIGQDGTYYVTQLTNKGTTLVPVVVEEKNKGLWHNIHAKRKRGEKPAKPGDKDYPKTLDIDENDKEGKMAKFDAKETYQDAVDVFKMIDQYDDLPEWLEAKITKASDYMNSVKDYLTHHHSGTNEGKLKEQISSFNVIQDRLVDLGFGNMVVSWRGTKKKVKDIKPGNRIDNITLEKTINTLLKNKSMSYDGNDYKVTPQGKKYFKGTLQLEGKTKYKFVKKFKDLKAAQKFASDSGEAVVTKSKDGQWNVSVLEEAKKRDYKAEYKKFQSSTKAKKYRAELNKYNRQKGTYGNGDKKDASHKGGKIAGFEAESKNRGRAEKSRLKKEGVVNEGRDDVIKKLFIQMDKQSEFKNIKGAKTSDFNKVKKWVKKRAGIPEFAAGVVALDYTEYKAGKKKLDQAVKDVVKHLGRKYNK